MPTKKQTISVRVDDVVKRQLELAARLENRSAGAFLERAGEEHARDLLMRWALDRHRAGEASFSELAEETGFAVEEIMRAASTRALDATFASYLSSCRAIAEKNDDPEFLRAAEEAVEQVRAAAAERQP